jgi:tetratricopeptide (TPR) repeat protein
MASTIHTFGRRAALALLWLVAAAGPALAQRPPNVTAGELALLPEYCPDTQGFNYGDQYGGNMSPRAPQWVALMGQTFWHHHHYCWGLVKMQRARRPGIGNDRRRGGFIDAIGDFDYVIRKAPPDFPILPELYLRMGEAYEELGEIDNSLQSFAQSAKYKRDYWPAYVAAARVFERANLKARALGQLAEGLRYLPDEERLRAPYVRLGGDLRALLQSYAAAANAPAAAPAASAPAPASASTSAPTSPPAPAPASPPAPTSTSATAAPR